MKFPFSRRWITLAIAAASFGLALAGNSRVPVARAIECPEGEICPEEMELQKGTPSDAANGPGIPIVIQYHYPQLPRDALMPQRKGRFRLHTTKAGRATFAVWSDDETRPRKMLEFEVSYQRNKQGGFSFDGAIHTGSRVELRAIGDRDFAGYVNVAHLHEVGLVNLPRMGKWDAQFRLSGRMQLIMPALDGLPNTAHLEPANAKVEFQLPLKNKRMFGVGAEGGAWLTGIGDDYGIAPGARAVLRISL